MKIPKHDNSDTKADSKTSMSNSINNTQEKANKMDPHMKMDPAMPDMKLDGMDMSMSMKHKKWQSIALSAFHCGAGCTLADLIGEWFSVWVPIQIVGSLIAEQWVFDFCLALVIGVFIQFFAIRQMEKISAGKAFGKAIKADFFSLTSWQVGMYVWMSIVFFAIFKGLEYQKDTWTFWFMMQVAMLIGFFFAYPTNALLIKLGIKKGM